MTNAYEAVLSISLDTALCFTWVAYAAVFLIAFIFTLCNTDVRKTDKRPFMSFTNAFAAVTFALALTGKDIAFSLLTATVFWCIGYLLYGFLVLLTRKKTSVGHITSAATAATTSPPAERFTQSATPAKGNVRLEHAISVTDKLLTRELARSDRQEVERIKSTLSLMQLKTEILPEENDRLNENFNTLLKLMAKYNL